jgi:hypothetical protein
MSEFSAADLIKPAGIVINPNHAIRLGNSVLVAADQWIRRTARNRSFSIYPIADDKVDKTGLVCNFSNQIGLSAEDRLLIEEIEAKFLEAIPGSEKYQVETAFIVGGSGESSWHIDETFDHRLLVCLSPFAVGLTVANSWNANDFCETNDRGVESQVNRDQRGTPADTRTIPYLAGRGVLIDNTPPSLNDHVPHHGSDEPNRVLTRSRAVPIGKTL